MNMADMGGRKHISAMGFTGLQRLVNRAGSPGRQHQLNRQQ